jgi:excisionase family DNA binding protein
MAITLRRKTQKVVALPPPRLQPAKAPSTFLTVKELAQRWHLSGRQIYRLIAEKNVPVYRIGRRVLISLKDIVMFEASSTEIA